MRYHNDVAEACDYPLPKYTLAKMTSTQILNILESVCGLHLAAPSSTARAASPRLSNTIISKQKHKTKLRLTKLLHTLKGVLAIRSSIIVYVLQIKISLFCI